MRRTILGLAVLVVGSLALFAADKDTALAANTRTKKLKAKITVDFKEEMLDECIKEFSRQLEEAGLGSLSANYDLGVSKNQRFTFAGKAMTVEDALDGMLKKNALGFVVVSKEKDRYDGWLKITKGSERGWPAGQEPKDAKSKGKDVKDAKEAKAAPADGEQTEREANGKLDLAKSLLKDGKTDKAKTRFQEVVDKYPNTKAAEEAKKELEKLGK